MNFNLLEHAPPRTQGSDARQELLQGRRVKRVLRKRVAHRELNTLRRPAARHVRRAGPAQRTLEG